MKRLPKTYNPIFNSLRFLASIYVFIALFIECTALEGETQYSQQDQQQKYKLVACAIFQNETFFLREWIEYHRLVGVEHFYLYNNLSTDNYLEVLKPYIDEGIVELFEWPIETSNQPEYLNLLQLPAYNDALEKIKKTAHWAAFIDLDEFIVPMRHDNLVDMLSEYEDCAALAINWQIFGTSNISDLPSGKLITESFILKGAYKEGMNENVKLIVQPQLVKSIKNPHAFTFHCTYFAVNSKRKPLKSGQMGQKVELDTVRINHYWFGSLRHLLECKLPRREKWGIKIAKEHLEELISSYNIVNDESILKFVPELKCRMSSTLTNQAAQGTEPKPFVTCSIMGQLGNQFFQIAAATSLALDHGAIPVFPCLRTEQQWNTPLNYAKVFYHLNTSQPENSIENIYLEHELPFNPIPFSPNMCIRGWFQTEKYFKHHKKEILALFAPHAEIKEYLQKKYSKIVAHNKTISIHYRSYQAEDPQHMVYAECDIEYYLRAIEMFPKDSLFVVFSNDIEWCKNIFTSIPRQFVFIEGEAHYNDLYLMSMCKHNIICNSSFSWWAAYLNENPNKKVIAPLQWFSPFYEPDKKDTKDLLPKEWIQI